MIKQTTIDAVFQRADIIEVVGAHVKLKRHGANHTGCCPFHDEKTPSFSVSPSKQIFKCFGCGKGGNVITFLMDHERLSFPDAVRKLADKYGIDVEEDQASAQVSQESRDKKKEMHLLVKWAADAYEKNLLSQPESSPVMQYLTARGYGHDRIKYWGIGYAPADFKFLTSSIINMGKHGLAAEIGLIKTKEGTSYDANYDRIIVPIHDQNGFITGLASRIIPGPDAKGAKWMNPPNSLIYNKASMWYGLNTARQAITREKMAYLVEGYPDVHTMQDHGITNTVAPCGKEIADDQIRLLKKYTDHVCFIPNIDDNESGQKAVLKHIDRFVGAGFRVSVVELPTCNDADEYINNILDINKMHVA